jgi:hypothetical protein
MFGQHWLKVAGEGHILTDEHPDAYYQGQTHALIVAVTDADREPAARHAGVEIEDPEHLHAVFGDGVLLLDNTNMPEPQSLDQGLDNFGVRHGPVSGRTQRCGNGGKLMTSQLRS